MCQISLGNTHNEQYNKLFFLLAGSMGSIVHDDGWGFVQPGSPQFKCNLPMHLTTNSGDILAKHNLEENNRPLLGHIRQASPKVPVTTENAHPFTLDDVVFVHNGKLTPVDEKKFVMEEEVDEIDSKTQKITKKKVSRSDSLIFFEHFMSIYEASSEKNAQKKFTDSVTKAMEDFTGKFAMCFLIGGTYYVVRGRSADLYISYLVGEKDESIGWVINTDKKVLDFSTRLLANISKLETGKELFFTEGKILDAESIYLAGDTGLAKIGTIVEKWTPVATTTYAWEGGRNFPATQTKNTSTTGSGGKTSAGKWAEKIYEFMSAFSLTLYDINNLFLIIYDCSIQEVQEHYVEHFCNKIMPLLKNATNKSIRKMYKKALFGGFPAYRYNKSVPYPWMLIARSQQIQLLEAITPKKD